MLLDHHVDEVCLRETDHLERFFASSEKGRGRDLPSLAQARGRLMVTPLFITMPHGHRQLRLMPEVGRPRLHLESQYKHPTCVLRKRASENNDHASQQGYPRLVGQIL